ncbi:hypothetical protein ABT381_00535 [Streptomyces sp. NPDC000151]|uniref:hypothetical protein n=1 Tax=Streptomyces sp. NPDC000151 TaxID=3154244 RepID=UPI00332FF28D
MKIKKTKEELEESRLAERGIVEALIGNYCTVLKNLDDGGPAQEALAKAAAMTAEAVKALEGLDEAAPVEEVARRLGGGLPGRARPGKGSADAGRRPGGGYRGGGGLRRVRGAVRADREGLRASRQPLAGVAVRAARPGPVGDVRPGGEAFDLAEKLEFTTTSEDRRVLDALAHAIRHESARGEYVTALGENGKTVDISFATQNWRKAVLDKTRPGRFVRKHFEAMVFTHLAEELRTGDVAVVGSEEYADWSEQLLAWEDIQEKPADYLVEVGLCEEGEAGAFDAASFRQQLEDKLRGAAAAADAGYPDNEGLVIDPETGIPSLWVEWWRRFGPPSGNAPKLKDPFGRYVLTTFVKGTNMGPYEAAKHIPGVSGH